MVISKAAIGFLVGAGIAAGAGGDNGRAVGLLIAERDRDRPC